MRKPVIAQPIIIDEHGTSRFQANRIVQFLLNAGPFDMNQIAELPGISNEERAQFAQLIGYSVVGFTELSYVDDAAVTDAATAERQAKDLESCVSVPPNGTLSEKLFRLYLKWFVHT